MLGKKKPPAEGAKIDKPEDTAWNEWYNNLDEKENENLLKKLGLDDEDIGVLEEIDNVSDILSPVDKKEAGKKEQTTSKKLGKKFGK